MENAKKRSPLFNKMNNAMCPEVHADLFHVIIVIVVISFPYLTNFTCACFYCVSCTVAWPIKRVQTFHESELFASA